MSNKLYEIFCPTSKTNTERRRSFMKLYNEMALERGCVTCANCEHVQDYPGFVTAEECECKVGLRCDTVLHNVKNCKKWEKREYE